MKTPVKHQLSTVNVLIVLLVIFFMSLLFVKSASAKENLPFRILSFVGYGHPHEFYLSGRTLKDKLPDKPSHKASKWKNLRSSLSMLETDEIEGVQLNAQLGVHRWSTSSDSDGVWHIHAQNVNLKTKRHSVQLIASHPHQKKQNIPITQTAYVHIIPRCTVALISDFDDTLAQTQVSSLSSMLKNTLFKNEHQVPLVKGATVAYQQAMKVGAAAVFYLSGSPHNLYERIYRFLQYHRLPEGPIFLKNIGEDSLFDQKTYKLQKIRQLLLQFPSVHFILIGDSGESDPEIYRIIQHESPNRIAGVVIRLVKRPSSMKRFKGMTPVFKYDREVLSSLVKKRLKSLPASCPTSSTAHQ